MKNIIVRLKWKHVLCLLILFLGMMAFMRYTASQVEAASGGTGILDLHFGNSPEQIKGTIVKLGTNGRSYYLKVFFLVDFFYPISYAFFYAGILLFLLEKTAYRRISSLRLISLLPFIGLVCDWLENFFISRLLIKYPDEIQGFYTAANAATVLKFVMVYLSLFSVVLLGILIIAEKLIRKIRKRV